MKFIYPLKTNTKSEILIWVFCLSLILSYFLPEEAQNILKYLGVNQLPKNGISLLIILISLSVFQFYTWINQEFQTKYSTESKFRVFITFGIALVAFFICYPLFFKGTPYESISRSWFALHIPLGFLISRSFYKIIFHFLFIRPESEANSIFKRIPFSIKKILKREVNVLIFILLPIVYFSLKNSPEIIKTTILYVWPLEFIIFIMCLHPIFDNQGNLLPFKKIFLIVKNIIKNRDYNQFLKEKSNEINVTLPIAASPKEMQKMIIKKIQNSSPNFYSNKGRVNFRIQTKDKIELSIQIHDKKLGLINKNISEIKIKDTKKDSIQASILFEDNLENRDFKTSASELIRLMKIYIKNQPEELFDYKIISFSLNEIAYFKIAEPYNISDTIASGEIESVKELIVNNCFDINKKDISHWTPLLHAVANDHLQITKLLLKNGANPNLENLLGATPLLYSVFYDNYHIAKEILKYNPKINHQDRKGDTALIIAVRNQSLKMIRLLLEKNPEKNIKNIKNQTALQIARQLKRGDIAKLLS